MLGSEAIPQVLREQWFFISRNPLKIGGIRRSSVDTTAKHCGKKMHVCPGMREELAAWLA
jgi:hypothetical protein